VIEGRFFNNQILTLRRGKSGSKKHGRPLLETAQPGFEGVGEGVWRRRRAARITGCNSKIF